MTILVDEANDVTRKSQSNKESDDVKSTIWP
jgi:hypothetical protein